MSDFFERFNSVDELSPKIVSDSLSSGLSWTGTGKNASELFSARVEKFLPEFVAAWKKSKKKRQLTGVLTAIERLINRLNTIDTIDEEMPLIRGRNKIINSFTYVRILKSLAILIAGEEEAEEFLSIVSSAESRPREFLFLVARSQLLLIGGEYRQAADLALKSRRLRAYDLCVRKTVFTTQETLFENGLATDVNYDFSSKDKLFCHHPFTTLNIFSRTDADDLVYGLCRCRGWMPTVFKFNKTDAWNSDESQEIRRSILDGSFKYCDKLKCPYLYEQKLPRSKDVEETFLRDIIDNNLIDIPRGPKTLVLAYDRSCNLSCPSCRDDIFMAKASVVKSFDSIIKSSVEPLLPDVHELNLSQTGEALASAHFRRFLKSLSPSKYPELKVSLRTNGKLLSQQTWNKIGAGAECIDKLLISIDGATPKTLEKLRRGLTWNELVSALEFARDLRKSSKLSWINVTFILQKDNFREIPDMLMLCSKYCCDLLTVAPITGHGEYTNEEFNEINVSDPKNLLYPEYRKIYENVQILIKEMQDKEVELVAEGRSVPSLRWRP